MQFNLLSHLVTQKKPNKTTPSIKMLDKFHNKFRSLNDCLITCLMLHPHTSRSLHEKGLFFLIPNEQISEIFTLQTHYIMILIIIRTWSMKSHLSLFDIQANKDDFSFFMSTHKFVELSKGFTNFLRLEMLDIYIDSCMRVLCVWQHENPSWIMQSN